MAISYPYSLASFADLLPIMEVVWDVQRNDEMSGSGDGRVWQAELARPLWSAEVRLRTMYHTEAKKIAALIRKLHGAQETFYLYDPISKYPQADPTGSIYGSSAPKVNSIASGKNAISIKSLPSAYALKAGDKVQITFGSPSRNFFCEVSEDATASAGTTPEFGIFPHVPTGVAVDNAVNLIKPACKMFIGSFDPGRARQMFVDGMSFRALERVR